MKFFVHFRNKTGHSVVVIVVSFVSETLDYGQYCSITRGVTVGLCAPNPYTPVHPCTLCMCSIFVYLAYQGVNPLYVLFYYTATASNKYVCMCT